MNWEEAYTNLRTLEGMSLYSISGQSDIKLLEVAAENVIVQGSSGQRSRPITELKRIVSRMELLYPIHVDSVLMGSGSSRNQPETMLANTPDVEWMNLNGRKHIVWVGTQTHSAGTIKELDPVYASQVRERFRGKGPGTGAIDTASLLILGPDTKGASTLVEALFQVPKLEPLTTGIGYHVAAEFGEVFLVPETTGIEGFEIIPITTVVDKDEAIARLKIGYPTVVIHEYDVGRILTVLRIPGSGTIAII